MFAIWIPKIAAFLAALFISWAAKRGFTLEQEATTAFFIGTFTIVQAVANKYLNPGNVAVPELVDQPKAEARSIRAAKRARRAAGN